jgi:hypothetical protein
MVKTSMDGKWPWHGEENPRHRIEELHKKVKCVGEKRNGGSGME